MAEVCHSFLTMSCLRMKQITNSLPSWAVRACTSRKSQAIASSDNTVPVHLGDAPFFLRRPPVEMPQVQRAAPLPLGVLRADHGARTFYRKLLPRSLRGPEQTPLWFCVTSSSVRLVSPCSFVRGDCIVRLEIGDFFCAGHLSVHLPNKTL